MKKLLCLLICFVLIAGCFSGCGDKRRVLYVYNAGQYINESLLPVFEKENPDIKICYETYYSNEEMYIKLKNSSSPYDVIFPSDYMIERMIEENLLRKINLDNIPNFANIDDQFKNMQFDPGNQYSVPYTYGTIGILYNKKDVDEEDMKSFKAIFDKKYAGKVLMMDAERDNFAIAMKALGYSINDGSDKVLNDSKELLLRQKDNVIAYCGDEIMDKMLSGEGSLAAMWSCDAYYCVDQDKSGNLKYSIPENGTNLWFDSMVIPKTSKHPEDAEKFINFICRTDVAKKNTESLSDSTCNAKARELLDDNVKNDINRYPDISKLTNMEIFRYDPELTKKVSKMWQEIKVE